MGAWISDILLVSTVGWVIYTFVILPIWNWAHDVEPGTWYRHDDRPIEPRPK